MIGGGTLMALAGGISLYEKHVYDECVVQAPRQAAVIRRQNAPAACMDVTKATNRANHAGHIAGTWGTGTFAVGAVAAAIGIALYFTAPDKERVDRPRCSYRRSRPRASASPVERPLGWRAGASLRRAGVASARTSSVSLREHGLGLGALALGGEHAGLRELRAAVSRSRCRRSVEPRRPRGSIVAVEDLAGPRDVAGLAERVDAHRGRDHVVLGRVRRGMHGRACAARLASRWRISYAIALGRLRSLPTARARARGSPSAIARASAAAVRQLAERESRSRARVRSRRPPTARR